MSVSAGFLDIGDSIYQSTRYRLLLPSREGTLEVVPARRAYRRRAVDERSWGGPENRTLSGRSSRYVCGRLNRRTQ
jgi:hypothetical protein